MGSGNFYYGYFSEQVIAYSAVTAAVRQAAESNQKAYYSTP